MRKWKLHLLLFLLTVLSTLFAGAYFIQDYDLFADFPNRLLPGLWKGVPFSIPLMIILAGHELAHYVNSRRHGVEATLPFFIPFPNLFGTLGAVITMKARIMDRRALVDIGASGPLVGFVLSVIACVIGLSLSSGVAAKAPQPEETVLGASLLYYFLVQIFVHTDLATQAVNLHPVAVAGWVGLFVTSINLMPMGQLDGGHVAYAFFPNRHRLVSRIFVVLLALMGIAFSGWLIWALLMVVLGTKHPPVVDPDIPLDFRRRAAGLASLVVFIITFTPVPVFIAAPK